ncbi:glucose/arabinose dehydrogenase [Lewinella aquimaris]|uniref:Glucose/arabinose dehydrogenase n=1 Tax=Neolewinella aquimaris TaxID=1835722 RepID=A0A840E9G6_9BACT|nr:PQQ-dependent sugar dehydrogenase [Neolewinella aquimaris]MBB4080583.1 glucose/arabinose dehydrogenase [Neolewinella aquimaris]
MVTISLGGLLGCRNNLIEVPESPYPISDDWFSVDTIARGFTIPYGIAIVNDGEYFITDRVGKMYHYTDGYMNEVEGMPPVATFGTPGIRAIMHGGLMDVSLHPAYADNGLLYVSYLDTTGLARVSRFQIQDDTATDFDTIFTTRNLNWTGNGMRIVWQDSTHFFLNVGNSDWSTSSFPILYAQDLDNDAGKIHRLLEDGSIPPDNPIFEGRTSPSTIWSYGHRDVQGLYYEQSTHTLFGVEHGPKGGDEFNIIEQGKNYGWPLVSYGINYDGQWVSTISHDSAAASTILPEHYWTVPTDDGGQALAPACLLKVDSSTIEDWNGHFLFGSLAYRRLMKFNRKTGETFGLDIEGRVRTIKQLPSGDVIALIERNDLTKANGVVVRIGE